jgi:hypothetical protein
MRSITAAIGTLNAMDDNQLPDNVRGPKRLLVAAMTDETRMGEAKIQAMRVLVDSIKQLAPVQFAVSVHALQLAQALKQYILDPADVARETNELMDEIRELTAAPADNPSPDVVTMIRHRDALAAFPNMERLVQHLRQLLTDHVTETPQPVQEAWNRVSSDPSNNLLEVIGLIGSNGGPVNQHYTAIRDAAQAIRRAQGTILRSIQAISAARNALIQSIVPDNPQVSLDIVYAARNLEEALTGSDLGQIEDAKTALLNAMASVAHNSPLFAAKDQFRITNLQINGRPTRTNRAKQACVDLFDHLTPDPVYEAIQVYQSNPISDEAKDRLISAIPEDRRSALVGQFGEYARAGDEVDRTRNELLEKTRLREQKEAELNELRRVTPGLVENVETATRRVSEAEAAVS